MIVHVTRKHIELGFPKSVANCPIALAIWEIEPDATEIVVNPPHVHISFDEEDLDWFMTPKAYNLATDFDMGRPILPFSFILAERLDPME